MKMHVFIKKTIAECFVQFKKSYLPLQPQNEKNNYSERQAKLRLGRIKARPVRLSVRTQDFHS